MAKKTKSAEGKPGKTVMISLKRGDDLLAEIFAACKRHNVKHGFIPTMAAALSEIELSVCESGNFKLIKGANVKIGGPAEFMGMGTISQKKGHTYLHLHGAFGMKGKPVVVGHLMAAKVAIVAEIAIQEIKGVKMTKIPDSKLFDYPVINL